MKLQSFVLLIAVVMAAGTFGLYLACKSSDKAKDPPPKEEVKKAEPAPPTPPAPPPKKKGEPGPEEPVGRGPESEPKKEDPVPAKTDVVADTKSDLVARPHDAEVIAWKDKTIPGDKDKDTSRGKAYKVAVYKDGGQKNVNRAKVDLNRNGKDDEKYSFEPDKITLQRAPADDEKYTETYRWNGIGWTKK